MSSVLICNVTWEGEWNIIVNSVSGGIMPTLRANLSYPGILPARNNYHQYYHIILPVHGASASCTAHLPAI